MTIQDNKVVSIEYTLKNSEGQTLDSSVGHDPLDYLHGFGNIIEGLESALAGKSVGDKLSVEISPENGYGERDEEFIEEVEKAAFSEVEELKEGMELYAEEEGQIQVITVVKIDGDMVTIDRNHPLAGQTLFFDVEVKAMRDATETELEHGHVHEAGSSCEH